MRTLVAFLSLLLCISSCEPAAVPVEEPAQPAPAPRPPAPEVAAALHEAYPAYREAAIQDRRFKHEDIEPIIASLPAPFRVKPIGESVEGRAIYEVAIGKGETPVLLWSQMHGDEPTATMALLDIFRFFQASGDGFDSLRDQLLEELTLHFIPMLNPDGAAKYARRNALGIDLNRDALRLQSPESVILKAARERTQAAWGFNLHDKNRYYAAGSQPKTAAVSFLAPAFNPEKDINEGRGNAMQLIVLMDEVLQGYIPDQVGRYDDTFEPRAFGDNIQKWGTNTILIESGGLKGDREKQYLRQLHFTILLTAMQAIATDGYEEWPLAGYEDIPFNDGGAFHDLLIRGAAWEHEGQTYTIDLAFRQREVGYGDYRSFYHRGSITDLGDLSTYHGYQELEATGLQVRPGKVYPKVFPALSSLPKSGLKKWLRQGYTTFEVEGKVDPALTAGWPVEVVQAGRATANRVELYTNPSLLLMRDGAPAFAIINGALFALEGEELDLIDF
ncbi:M14 family zinc carboxypeptidase [Phaeodactylibacter luteus]|uniref:Peptidase M14 n=1 Tax=Phaeodactylibacter luteus TaxID=1564516 RepID=A0A5C6RK66_9BACT|nr:M14 family zinc carboxypeptidase [Phaeodactylibacter luteus]TXB62587.1 peptidase M14 [Phaeodactylibacter luteus]